MVAGYERTAADAGCAKTCSILVAAADGAADGRRKLRAKIAPGCETVDVFTSTELDLALGRTNVIHAAVAKGGLAERLLNAARRVAFYESRTFELTRNYSERMSDTNDTTTKPASGRTLSVKRPVIEQGRVRQNFSHGRSKTVAVEIKRKRTPGVGEPAAPRNPRTGRR